MTKRFLAPHSRAGAGSCWVSPSPDKAGASRYLALICLLILGCDFAAAPAAPLRPPPKARVVKSLVRNGDLTLMSQHLADPRLKMLLDTNKAPIKSVSLSNNQLTAVGVRTLLESPATTHLMSLVLNRNKLGDAGAQALAASPRLLRLKYAQLASNQVTAEGVRALSATAGLRLLHLNLSRNPIGNAGAEFLAALEGVQKLSLEHCDIGGPGGRALLKSANVRELLLEGNPIGPDGLQGLTTLSPHLVDINLESCRLSQADIQVLTRAAAPHLRLLNLSHNHLSDAELVAITSATWFSTLEVLSLSALKTSPRARRALIEAWGDRSGLHVQRTDL